MSEKINPLYIEGSESIESEIKRMVELEWPLQVSSELLPANLRDKTVGDVGAGPNPNLGELVELRGGTYIAVDRNLAMAKKQAEVNPNVVQSDVLSLPFADKKLDILHTRFVLMNLPKRQRAEAIRELSRCGVKNIIMDYNWEKFTSENPTISDFISDARKIAELAGSDLNHGAKLKQLVEETLPRTTVIEQTFSQDPIKNYSTLAGLANSMQGLAVNLQNMEIQKASHENRVVNQPMIDMLERIKTAMEKYEAEFTKITAEPAKDSVDSFTPPGIVAVTF